MVYHHILVGTVLEVDGLVVVGIVLEVNGFVVVNSYVVVGTVLEVDGLVVVDSLEVEDTYSVKKDSLVGVGVYIEVLAVPKSSYSLVDALASAIEPVELVRSHPYQASGKLPSEQGSYILDYLFIA